MKIDLLDLIEEALVGGTNGQMAFIPNNQFIYDLFYKTGVNFKEFLTNAINEKEDEYNDLKYIPVTIDIHDIINYLSENTFSELENAKKEYYKKKEEFEKIANRAAREASIHPIFTKFEYIDGKKIAFKNMVFEGKIRSNIFISDVNTVEVK